MRIIVITSPDIVPGEADVVTRLLESGAVWRVHLRRPDADECEMRRLIESLPAGLRHRLTLHSHFGLAASYGLGGVHLNSRQPVPPPGFAGIISRSCHSIEELSACRGDDYAFISPVFDSISKSGYKAAFGRDDLRHAASSGNVFALGGVTPANVPLLSQLGFAGAAMMGCVWNAVRNDNLETLISQIRCYNS